MDIGDTLTPNSDGITNFDLLNGPRIVTIVRKEVTPYKPGVPKKEQYPVSLYTAEFGDDKPYRPNLTMRRLLAELWGGDSDTYVGRRIELFRDATVKIGPKSKPGVRISAVSHISKPTKVTLPESKVGDRDHLVQPLPDAPVDPEKVTAAINAIRAAADTTTLDAIEKHAQQLGITGHITDTLNTRRTELGGDA